MAKTLKLLFIPKFFSDERSFFFSNIRSIDKNVLSGSDSRSSETLLFVFPPLTIQNNTSILNTTIDFILSFKRLNTLLTTL